MSTIRDIAAHAATTRSTAPPGDRARLMEACRQVEGLFLSQLMQAVDRPTFGEGVLGDSQAAALFRGRRNQAVADQMGARGELGLAQMLYDDLVRRADAADATGAGPGDDANTASGS